MNKDFATKMNANIAATNGQTFDTVSAESNTEIFPTIATTSIQLIEGDQADLSDGASVESKYIIIGDNDGVMTGATTTAGTQGTVTDTTSYDVLTQATKTEIITLDGGDAQTVTFTTAIDIGRITDTTSYPVTDQDGLTSIITLDGGSPQTVTFSGATTTALSVATQITAQITGGSAEVVSDQVVVTSDTIGATSAVAAAAGTGGLTWAAATKINTVTGIASQIDTQIYGGDAAVVSGQVVITSRGYGATSAVVIGVGTTDITWDTAVDGTGGSGAYVLYSETGTGVIGYVGKKRYIRYQITNPSTDTTLINLRTYLSKAPELS